MYLQNVCNNHGDKMIIDGNDTLSFEWDEAKRINNITKHFIDFEDAKRIFESKFLRKESNQNNEIRYLALGKYKGFIFAVAYAERNKNVRIISARLASAKERNEYNTTLI
jgi:uncharacterized protein